MHYALNLLQLIQYNISDLQLKQLEKLICLYEQDFLGEYKYKWFLEA